MTQDLLAELNLLVDIHATEDVHTEFKRSAIIKDRKSNDLTKEICAFANSDGGNVYIGVIEGKNGAADALDEGVSPEMRGKEWIEQIIESQIQPKLKEVMIEEIQSKKGLLYKIDIKRSASAPHQNQDKRYYKRSGAQSLPMEDYEIQDVRARTLIPEIPLLVELKLRGFLFHLKISNVTDTDVYNLQIRLESNFQDLLRRRGLDEKKLTTLKKHSNAEYVLGSGPEIFGNKGTKPNFVIKIDFIFLNERGNLEEIFSIHDYEGQVVVRSQEEEYLKKIGDELEKIEKNQREILSFMNKFTWPADGTGIHISTRTVEMLKGSGGTKYDPCEMDVSGFMYLLKIGRDDARQIWQTFNYIGANDALEEVAKLGEDVLARFRELFILDGS